MPPKESDEFEVEKVTKVRTKENKKEYYVKWKGYPVADSTWEPAKSLSTCAHLIKDFHAKEKKLSKPPSKKKAQDETVYEVEEIKDNIKDQYLVKWKGYDSDDNTWESIDNLASAKDKVATFLASKAKAVSATKAKAASAVATPESTKKRRGRPLGSTSKKSKKSKTSESKKSESKTSESKEDGDKLHLGYWAIRGLGAPLRMLLEFAGADYEDHRYSDAVKWFKEDKPDVQGRNPLANLPYLTVGGTTVSQTNAILKFLGDKFGLCGATPAEAIWCDQLCCEVMDLRNKMTDLVYPRHKSSRTKEEFDANAIAFLDTSIPTTYDKLTSCLKSTFLGGTSVCVADFHAWEMLDQTELLAKRISKVSPLSLPKYSKLKALHAEFRALPELNAYFKSPAYRLPINSEMANAYFL